MSMCAMHILYAHCFFLGSYVELCVLSYVDFSLLAILDNMND